MPLIEHNIELQEEYDKNVNDATIENIKRKSFDVFGDNTLFFVSSQNSYFNNYVDENGLNNLRLDEDDADIINQLFSVVSSYGTLHNYGKFGLLYVAPSGSLELDYARQSFPSGILEDVFKWGEGRKYPYPWYTFDGKSIASVDFVVGEPEYDYWMRVILKMIEIKRAIGEKIAIDNKELSNEELQQFESKVLELLKKFCTGKNRIYYINIMQVLNNNHSGFAEQFRGGKLTEEEFLEQISGLPTIEKQINSLFPGDENIEVKANKFLKNIKHGHNRWGIAIIGDINGPISYVDVKTNYQLLQEYFLSQGYTFGDVIDYDTIYKLYKEQELVTDPSVSK